MSEPAQVGAGSVDFLITKGSSASLIASNLKEKGLIKNSLAFRIYTQITGISKKIQAGEYSLSANDSLFKIADLLTKGPRELWVTIPEGLRREQIAVKFATSLVKKDENSFVQEFLAASAGNEGSLFPDTYLFPKTATAEAIVSKMLTTFEKKTNLDATQKNTKDIVNRASIIERETLSDEERPIVAGILDKRLKARWPLQVDATLQYAVASVNCKLRIENCTWWEPVLKADLEIKSAYNTYKYPGLPPAPICNPGLSSIKAALAPTASDYWYYLHDKDGAIHYAKTIEEHNLNIQKYLSRE